MIVATNEGGGFSPVEAVTYLARCFKMVHIGTVLGEYQGKKSLMNKIWICWELPTEQREFKDGEGKKPYVVSKEFTLSMNEKATLRLYLESWRGKRFTEEEAKHFDVTKLLGKPCTLSIAHKESSGKTYANITGVSPVMKGMEVPNQINETFELNYENFMFDAFNTLPDFIKKKIETSNEFKRIENNEQMAELEARSQTPHTDGIDNDDIPF